MPNFPKGSENYIIKTDEDIKKFLGAVAKRTISILRDEVKINALEANHSSLKESHINLIGLTSIISVEDYNKITVVFNYDDTLIEEIFIRYTKNIEIPEDETRLYIDETASDLINVIIGNVLSQFGQLDYAFNISTPLVLSGSEYIAKFNGIKAYATKIKTDFGQMQIFCIVPGNKFLNNFLKL